jgi:hypothetical protein
MRCGGCGITPRTCFRTRTRSSSAAAILSIVCLLSWPSSAIGFTGHDWQQRMGPSQRTAYIAGALEAWGAGGTDHFQSLYGCVSSRSMTAEQVHAIVDKYVKENPALWGTSLVLLVSAAIAEACK